MSNLTNQNSYLVNKMFPPKKQTTADKIGAALFCILFLGLCFGWFFILTGFIPALVVTLVVAFFGLIALH